MSMQLVSPNGIHHLAISTADIKGVLAYFNEVLGLPLIAFYWMHGAENTVHAFLKLNDVSSLAFVFSPLNPDRIEPGLTHAGHAAGTSAKGTLQHIAFNVDSKEAMLALRDRIRSHNVHCFGPVQHGFCESIYFAGPEGLTLEIATSTEEDITQWIDPSAVVHLGISPDELSKLMNPTPFEAGESPVPQPTFENGSKFRLAYPEPQYKMMVQLPDEVVTMSTRDAVPPNKRTT